MRPILLASARGGDGQADRMCVNADQNSVRSTVVCIAQSDYSCKRRVVNRWGWGRSNSRHFSASRVRGKWAVIEQAWGQPAGRRRFCLSPEQSNAPSTIICPMSTGCCPNTTCQLEDQIAAESRSYRTHYLDRS